MKKITRIAVILISVCLVLSIFCAPCSAIVVNNNASVSYTSLTSTSYTQNVFVTTKKEEKKSTFGSRTKKQFEGQLKVDNVAKNASDIGVGIAELCTGKIDWGEFGFTALKGVANAVASIWGFGGTTDAVFDLIKGIADATNPKGEEPLSEVEVLTNKMNDQFSNMASHMDDIQDDIAELSNTVTEEASKIVDKLTTEMNALDAGQYVRTFTISGEGNFSYNQFQNYLFGKADSSSNLYYNQAYYDILLRAIISKAPDDVIKSYYDELYDALMSKSVNGQSNYIMYYEYLTGEKSISRYYYDLLSANPSLVTDGETASTQAISFAIDKYITAIKANTIIEACNYYQMICLREQYGDSLSDYFKYCFNPVTGEYVTYKEILDNVAYLEFNKKVLEDRLLADIAYISEIGNSYFVEDKNGDIYDVINSNPDTFGQVVKGQTIYLNEFYEELVEGFGDFDYTQCKYIKKDAGIETPTNLTVPIIEVGENDFTVTAYYGDVELYSIAFHVGATDTFNGGDGSEAYPYNISNIQQYALIDGDLFAHYRLIDDLDFGGATISAIGDYDSPFCGALDGNGYHIKNATVISEKPDNETKALYVGLFKRIGNTGCVKNVDFDSITLISKAKKIDDNDSDPIDSMEGYAQDNCFYYQGIVTGYNDGIIENCHISNMAMRVYRYNTVKNKCITTCVGGIAGENYGTISYCTVNGGTISAKTYISYDAESDSKNANSLYVGGITGTTYGTVSYCGGKNINMNDVSGESRTNVDRDTKPTLNIYSGGISGIAGQNARFDVVFSTISPASPNSTVANDSQGRKNIFYVIGSWFGSNDGKYTAKGDNVSKGSDSYISKTNVQSKAASFDSVLKPVETHTVSVACQKNVENGSQFLDESALYVQLDGKALVNTEKTTQYVIIGTYGFDSRNAANQDASKNLTILAKCFVGDEEIIRKCDCKYVVEENQALGFEVIDLPVDPLTRKLGDLKIRYIYSTPIENTDTVSSDGYVWSFVSATTSTEVVPEGNSEQANYGLNKIIITIGDFSAKYTFVLECPGHQYERISQKATCAHIGYEIDRCTVCGHEELISMQERLKTHFLLVAEEGVEATCSTPGNTGTVYCKECGEIIVENMVIPKKPHTYVYSNETEHVCSICGKGTEEAHQYTVSEYINEDGNWVYVYSCYSCGYHYEVVEDNVVSTDSPRLVVSDGFALKGGDTVKVYVQLLNNPGINAACIGIRYDAGLILKSYNDGDVLNGNISESHEVNCGCNFLWASADTSNTSGNILALEFLVPYDATVGSSYNVDVVYGVVGQNDGGFVLSDDSLVVYVTRCGTISVVEHLPGDSNNDGVVDMMDAIYVARCVTGKISETNYTKKYVDVNLDTKVNVVDVVYSLQALNGGYGKSFVNQEYFVVLNGNGISLDDDTISVSVYDEDTNVYSLYSPTREGYTFLGWFTRLVDGTKIEDGTPVVFDNTQIKQALYAHWERNQLVFEMANATSDPISSVSYSRSVQSVILVRPVKEYSVKLIKFKSINGSDPSLEDTCKFDYEFLHWRDENGNTYPADYEFDLSTPDIGCVTLTAVWSTVKLAENETIEASVEGYEFGGYYAQDPVLEIIDKDLVINSDNLDAWILANRDNNNRSLLGTFTKIRRYISFDISAIYVNGEKIPCEDITFFGENPLPVEYGEKYSSLWIPEKTGYIFDGWYLKDQAVRITGTNAEPITSAYFRNNGESCCTENITVVPYFHPIKYTVKYNENEPKNASGYVINVPGEEQWTYDEDYRLALAPSLIGWTFGGWYKDAQCTKPVGDSGELLEKPNLSSKDGDTVTLYAKWTANTYTVNYNSNTPANASGTVLGMPASPATWTYDQNATLASAPSLVGWTFGGWYLDSNHEKRAGTAGAILEKPNLSSKDGDTVILYAKWTANTYTVKYNSNTPANASGTVLGMPASPATWTYDQNATLASAPSLVGWTFGGWYKDVSCTVKAGDGETDLTMPNFATSGTVNLYAKWTANTYTVKYNSNTPANASGTVWGMPASPATWTYDQNATLASAPSLVGWTFGGWYKDVSCTVKAGDGETDLTIPNFATSGTVNLYAKWTANTYKVIYNRNEPENASHAINNAPEKSIWTYDSTEQLGNAPVLEGWTFGGWYLDANYEKSAGMAGAILEKPNLSSKDGDTVTLYAKWIENEYTIIYHFNDGTDAIKTVTLKYEESKETEVPKERPGYSFRFWSTSTNGMDGKNFEPDSTVKRLLSDNGGIIHLYAIWGNPNKFFITYELFGGIGNIGNPIEYTVESEISLKDPTKEGYTFDGWYSDAAFGNRIKEITIGTTGNITLYAKWTVNTYTVIYNSNTPANASGTVLDMPASPATWTYDQNAQLASAPSLVGWTFGGWYKDVSCTVKAGDGETDLTMPNFATSGTVNLYAKWTANTYTVKYNSNTPANASGTVWGMPASPATWTYDQNVQLASAPSLVGWIFGGWYKDDSCTVKVGDGEANLTMPNFATTGTVDLYAKWTAITYSVVYNLNNGVFGDTPASSVLFDSVLTVSNPTRAGYAFAGWTITGLDSCTHTFGGITSDETSKSGITDTLFMNLRSSSGVVTFTAQWSCTDYSTTLGNASNTTRYTIRHWHSWGHDDDWTATETVNPHFDVAWLLENGYKTMEVEVTYEYKVDDWGDQLLRIYSTNNVLLKEFKHEKKECDWTSRTESFVINLKDLSSNDGSFLMNWDVTDGDNSDTWCVGKTTVRVTASGRVSYSVQLNSNDGTNEIRTYDYIMDVPRSLPENEFIREGYSLIGWNTQADGKGTSYNNGEQVKNLTTVPNGIFTLYAQWKLNPYVIGSVNSVLNGQWIDRHLIYKDISDDKLPANITGNNTDGDKLIIYWGNIDFDTRYSGDTLQINSPFSEIYIIGNPGTIYRNVNIVTNGYGADTLKLYLVNVMLEDSSIKNIVAENGKALSLEIECLGDNSIISSDRIAIDGYQNVTIYGTGNLTVKGGDGENGINAGECGGDGYAAISVSGIVSVDIEGTLSVLGGDGGKGSDGRDQALGNADSSAPAKATTDGGSGGAGGTAIMCNTLDVLNAVSVWINGGAGGNAGNGGSAGWGSYTGYARLPDGANGGAGGNGGLPIKPNTIVSAQKSSNITLQYGDGGSGGDGGQGGNANWNENGVKPDTGGNGGAGGAGGAGYNGGAGGAGGKGGYSFANEGGGFIGIGTSWQYGQSGSGGNAGKGGNAIASCIFENGSISYLQGTIGLAGNAGEAGDRGTKDNSHYSYAGSPGSSAENGVQTKVVFQILQE